MKQNQFLLELGVEELPEKQITIACNSVKLSFANFLKENKLNCSVYKVSGTETNFLAAIDLDSHQKMKKLLKQVRFSPRI